MVRPPAPAPRATNPAQGLKPRLAPHPLLASPGACDSSSSAVRRQLLPPFLPSSPVSPFSGPFFFTFYASFHVSLSFVVRFEIHNSSLKNLLPHTGLIIPPTPQNSWVKHPIHPQVIVTECLSVKLPTPMVRVAAQTGAAASLPCSSGNANARRADEKTHDSSLSDHNGCRATTTAAEAIPRFLKRPATA